MGTEKVVALIPARGGSKGVPGKNIRVLGGFPLIAYSIAVAKKCRLINRVIVSTDSEEIAQIARRFGAEVPFLRPGKLAGDQSGDSEWLRHALGWFQETEGGCPDYVVHLRPTTPLRDPVLVDQAVGEIMANPEATSLRSAHEAPESPFKWFLRDSRGFFQGMNPSDDRPGYANLPRQMHPVVYIPNGYVDVLRTSVVRRSEDIHGPRILSYLVPPCVEVDSLEEFEFLEFKLQRQRFPAHDLLREAYPTQADHGSPIV